MNLNLYLFELLNNIIYRSTVLDHVVYFLAEPFGLIVIGCAILTLCIIFLRDVQMHISNKAIFTEMITIVISMSTAWIVSVIIKTITHIPRPFLAHPSSQLLFLYGGYNSFPSGHATVFFALATAIYFYNRFAGIVFYVCAILISLSRVASGIHYPIDIIVGAFIGVVIGRLAFMVLQKTLKNKSLN